MKINAALFLLLGIVLAANGLLVNTIGYWAILAICVGILINAQKS